MVEQLGLLTAKRGSSLRDAMVVIDRGTAGICLVVDEQQKLLGVLTDGDIRRALLRGADLESPLGAYVSRRFTAVSVNTSRAEVLDLMKARLLQQVPILDTQGILVGLHLLRELVGTEDKPNWAVVMAGGRGERLRPYTDSLPKPMIPVAGRPILERIVLHLVGYGIRRIFLSVNYLPEHIERHFGDGGDHGCRIEYLREEKPLGTGGSLSLLPDLPVDPLLVLNGDLLTQVDVAGLLAYFNKNGLKALVGVQEYVHTVPFGVVDLQEGKVSGLREKPSHVWLANAGIYVLAPEIVARVPSGELFHMPELIEGCLERGEPVGAYQIQGDWIDIGHQRALRQARGEGL